MMDQKVGQAPYEQPSVFSFFKPEYKPPGPAAKALVVVPEAEVMSSAKASLCHSYTTIVHIPSHPSTFSNTPLFSPLFHHRLLAC